MAKQAQAAAKPAQTNAQVYALGKPYNVRPNTVQDNAASWALVTAQLQKAGPQTAAQLVELVGTRNHKSFVGYAIKRGWLAPAKA